MGHLAALFFAVIIAPPSGSGPTPQYHRPDVPPACGKFPKLVPYGVWLQVDDGGHILWTVEKSKGIVWETIDAKNLGPRLKREKAVAEKTSNFIIGFAGGVDKDSSEVSCEDSSAQRIGF
jgi:hypothetical protein